MDDWYDELYEGQFDTPIFNDLNGALGRTGQDVQETADQTMLDYIQMLMADYIVVWAQPDRGPRVIVRSTNDGFVYSEAHRDWARTSGI